MSEGATEETTARESVGAGELTVAWPRRWATSLSAEISAVLEGWGFPIAVVVGMALILEVVGLIAWSNGPREPFGGDWQNLVYSGRFSELLSIWQRWDALWYQHIAEAGYHAGDGSIAFFPLFPLLSWAVSLFVVGNTVLAELIVSGISFVVAMGVLRKLADIEFHGVDALAGDGVKGLRRFLSTPVLTVLLVAAFPTGFFLLAPYTESLFLALTVVSFYLARTGRPWAAGAVGLLASLTRAQGIFLSLGLAFESLRDGDSWVWPLRAGGRRPRLSLLAAGLPALGTLLLVLYQRNVLGEVRSGFDALALWGYRLVPPWEALGAAWLFIKGGHAGNGQPEVELFTEICLLGFAAIAIVGARKLPFSYWLYAWPSLGLLLTREMYFSPIMSTARYVLVLFPCFMVLALWLAPRPRLAAAWLVLSFVLQIVLFQYWVRWGFVG
jgi:hypothetical protein